MGKVPGSGRKAGTPNKKIIPLEEIAESLQIHPFKILLHFAAGDWKALGFKAESDIKFTQQGDPFEVRVISAEARLKAAAHAAEYLYSKKKQIEFVPDPTEGQIHTTKKLFSDFCMSAGYPLPYPKQVEMMGFCLDNHEPRLLLGARGYGKTDYVTILGTAYDIYLNPENTNLIITKSKVRNTALINEIANALTKNGVELEKENSSCIRIKGLIGKDESVEVITIKTSMRGRHPKRVIMDDPVTEEDVSEAMRLLVKRKYNEVMKLTSNVAVIGQPAHKYDLYSELSPMVKKMELPFGSIPELDHDLEAQRLAGVDEASIQASYFLKVLSESASPFDKVNYLDKFPTGGTSVAFIDPSDGGNDTAVSIFKQYGQGVAIVGYTWKRAWHLCIPDMAIAFKRFGVAKCCFETNKHGQQPLDVLRTEFKDLGIGVSGRMSNTNKHSRIMAAGTFAHLLHISRESDKNYINHVVKYELGAKIDDAPDSLATGLEWIGLIRGKQ